MKSMTIFMALLLCIFAMPSKSETPNKFPVLKGPYFGQKQPGLTPEIFAPGIVSIKGRYEGGVNFSPDLNEMYFSPTINGQSVVHYSKLENNKWTAPQQADFTKGKASDEFAAFVSANGKRIYFATYDEKFPLKIWYVNRLKDAWSDAILLDSPINNDKVIKPVAAKNGDLFYLNSSKRKMYYAPYDKGQFPSVQEVGIEYGSLGFISPSQDYLVVEAHKDNDKTKDKDIYVYFKNEDTTWSPPINLGDAVNTHYREGGPTISPDGKFLFFNRYNETKEGGNPDVYWVSTDIIHQLKNAYFKKSHS